MSAPGDVGPHPTAMELDRAELGSLPQDRRPELDAHVRACARCAEAQRALQQAAARFRDEVFPRSLPRVVAATGSPAALIRRWWSAAGAGVRWASVAAPVVAGLVLAAGLFTHKDVRPAAVDQEPAVSAKGGPALHLYVRRGDRVFAAQSGELLAPGDAVRFSVEPAGHRYLLILSIDGAGTVSVYHPFAGTESAPLPPGPRVELPGSIVLDRAPGPEQIVALLSDAALSAAAVSQQLQRQAPLPPNTEQISFRFEKKVESHP